MLLPPQWDSGEKESAAVMEQARSLANELD
jgi:hypothetical protein